MADPTRTNGATGTAATSSVNATFGFTATANRLLVLQVASDDYDGGNPSGWTMSTGCAQEVFHGAYVWWKIAAGSETSVTYTLGAAANSAWIVSEYDSIATASSLDISNGQSENVSLDDYTTPSVSTTSGRRFGIACMGASHGSSTITGTTTWLNSYTEVAESLTSTGARLIAGQATLAFDGGGSTSSGCTFETSTPQSRSGIILVFKVDAGGGQVNAPRAMQHFRRRR
jgi:hypothetical protein